MGSDRSARTIPVTIRPIDRRRVEPRITAELPSNQPHTMKEFFEQRRPHDGLTYDQYLAYWQEQMDRSMKDLDRDERKMMHYYRYNWERSEQVMAEYEPSDALREAVQAIDEPQLWMVITEPWCGDSAFNLPVVVQAAELHDDVEVRILLRDDHPDRRQPKHSEARRLRHRRVRALHVGTATGERSSRLRPPQGRRKREDRAHPGLDCVVRGRRVRGRRRRAYRGDPVLRRRRAIIRSDAGAVL